MSCPGSSGPLSTLLEVSATGPSRSVPGPAAARAVVRLSVQLMVL